MADARNHTIRRVAADGTVSTFAGLPFDNGRNGAGGEGNSDGVGNDARFRAPLDVVVSSDGGLLVADSGNHTIRKITPTREVTTWAGMAGGAGFVDHVGELARFNEPAGITSDATGDLYVADRRNGAIRKITMRGEVSTVARGFHFPEDVAIDSSGNIFVSEPSNGLIKKISPAGDVSTVAGGGTFSYQDGPAATAGFFRPEGLAFDAAGNLFVADSGNDLIRKITPAGIVSTFAGTQYANSHRDGVGGAAFFDSPTDLAFDAGGNLLVADWGNNSIRKITPAAEVSTLAGTPGRGGGPVDSPRGVAVHPDGTAFIVDDHGVQKLGADGVLTRIGGLPASRIAFNSSGFFFITDVTNHTVRSGGRTALSQLLNLSTRVRLRGGEDTLIGGIIMSGGHGKRLSVRAIGPSLATRGMTDELRDPALEIRSSTSALIAANDNWKEKSGDGRAILDEGLPPAHDAESAIVRNLQAVVTHTAIVRSADGGSGVALVEVYDADSGHEPELLNISSRGFVGVGDDVMIAGFVMGGGEGTGRVVIRAIGPSLSAAGVDGALTDPVLSLHDGDGATIAANDDWKDNGQMPIEETGVPPSDERESALMADLPRGHYTAVVRGKTSGTTGIGLVEIYKLPSREIGPSR